MGKKVIIYGVGVFYIKNKTAIDSLFSVSGFVDRSYNERTNSGLKPMWANINECTSDYDFVLIATETPEYIFEILGILQKCGIQSKKILLGISYFGPLSKYFNFDVCDTYEIKCTSKYGTIVTGNNVVFMDYVRSAINKLVSVKGEMKKKELATLYEDKLQIIWLDKHLWSTDHNIDVYYLYEKKGYFTWAFTAVYALMALKNFEHPYVMELACGDAYYFSRLYKFIEGIKYIGTDIDTKIIEKARHDNEVDNDKCIFKVADITKEIPLPVDKSTFDVIIWTDSYSVFQDDVQQKIIKSIRERLGDNGILFLCDYYSEKGSSDWVYRTNPVNDKEKLRRSIEKYFHNVFLYLDINSEMFYLLASNGTLPVKN